MPPSNRNHKRKSESSPTSVNSHNEIESNKELSWIAKREYDLVFWLDNRLWGDRLRGILPVIVPLIMVTLGVSYIKWQKSIFWVVFVLVWFLQWLEVVLERYKKESALEIAESRLSELQESNRMFAGVITDVSRELCANVNCSNLDERTSLTYCEKLLQRVKEYATYYENPSSGVRLRATLAVPQFALYGKGSLRVWCYDSTYTNRNYSVLFGGFPGAPEAFMAEEKRSINDIDREIEVARKSASSHGNSELAEKLRNIKLARNKRQFKSVYCIPVLAPCSGKENSGCLAVLNLDASEVGFFDAVEKTKLLYALDPIISTIALVLSARHPEAKYGFPR